MNGNTIAEYVRHWSTVEPDKTAFIFSDVERNRRIYSRKDIFQLSSKYAAILRRNGVTRGDVVCNTLPNSPERLVTDFGCALAGAAVLNGQVFLVDDFLNPLKSANCRAVIVDPDDNKGANQILEKHEHRKSGKHVMYKDIPSLRVILECRWFSQNGKKSLMDILEDETETFVDDVSPEDEAYIFTTSGSTGMSKLVPKTHREIIRLCKAFVEVYDMEPTDIYYDDRPLGWGGGYPNTYIVNGSTRALTDLRKGPPEDVGRFKWDLICNEKCKVAVLIPYDLQRLTRICSEPGAPQWKFKHVVTAGQPVLKLHLKSIGKLTDAVVVGYGSTECGPVAFHKVTDADTFKDCNAGKLLSGTMVKLVDEDLKEVPTGATGELLIKGQMVCRKYLDNEKATREAFLDGGWFRTGDLGFFNSEGYLHVIGRKQNTILHGSFAVYPVWLELRIQSYPGVQNVVVIPVPDPVLNQEICACVITEPGSDVTAQTLNEYCKTLFLTADRSEMTSIPKYYVFFEKFPTNKIGKISRQDLIRMAMEKIGIKDN